MPRTVQGLLALLTIEVKIGRAYGIDGIPAVACLSDARHSRMSMRGRPDRGWRASRSIPKTVWNSRTSRKSGDCPNLRSDADLRRARREVPTIVNCCTDV